MKFLNILAAILLIVGGINWGLVGVFNFNLVSYIFGEANILTVIIYALVGIAGIYQIFNFKQILGTQY